MFLGKESARLHVHPWEKGLPASRKSQKELNPSQVQRDFSFLLQAVGTPAKDVRKCTPGKGREYGDRLVERQKHDIIIKTKQKAEREKKKKIHVSTEKKLLLGFQEKVKHLKTLKLEKILSFIEEMIPALEIKEEDWKKTIRNLVPL